MNAKFPTVTQNPNEPVLCHSVTRMQLKCFGSQPQYRGRGGSHCTLDTGGGVLIFLDLELRVQAKNMDNLK